MSSPRRPRPGAAFGVLAIAVFLAILDLFIVNIAFPAIRGGFPSASVSDLSWILSAYAIVFAAVLVPAGKLADIVGRRRVFLAGLLLFLGGSAFCAAAPSVGLLIGARVLQAVGGAAVTPTSLGLAVPLFPPRKHAIVIGLWAAIVGVGAAAGPVLGGLLVVSILRSPASPAGSATATAASRSARPGDSCGAGSREPTSAGRWRTVPSRASLMRYRPASGVCSTIRPPSCSSRADGPSGRIPTSKARGAT